MDRRVHDHAGRNKNHCALYQGGDILGFAVAKLVVIVGRLRGNPEGIKAGDGRDEIHDGFEGIREEAHRAGKPRGQGLEDDGSHSGGDG